MAASGRDFEKQSLDSSMEIDGALQFQDIDHTTVDLGGSGSKLAPTRADETDDEDAGDADTLIKSEKKTSTAFWTFEYYQQFFDIDTYQVGTRLLGSMLPNPRRNFLQHHVRQSPDLYGPFWVCTTLVFTIAITGNVANYFQMQGNNYQWVYDFHKVTLSAAAIYSYWWLVPLLIWGVLLWRGNKTGVTFLEILCLYGYSLTIYIPISLLWVIQVSWLQWLLVLLGMALSGSVVILTLWPAVSQDEKRVSIAVMSLIVIFHGLLAAGFMLYFFHVPDTSESTVPATTLAPVSIVPEKMSEAIHSAASNTT